MAVGAIPEVGGNRAGRAGRQPNQAMTQLQPTQAATRAYRYAHRFRHSERSQESLFDCRVLLIDPLRAAV
jgi:hypothetical protein